MATTKRRKFSPARPLVWLCVICAARLAVAEDTNVPGAAAASAVEAAVISNQTALRSSLEIQDQLHNLMQADEKSRRESAAESARVADLLAHRLDLIESSLSSQRLDEFKDMQRSNLEVQHSNQTLLLASIAFACFGCVVLLFSAFLQWQMVNRVRSLASGLPAAHGLGEGSAPAALGMGETTVLASPGLERSTAQFLSAMERLEKRIREIESAAHAPHRSLAEGGAANGDAVTLAAGPEAAPAQENGAHPPADGAEKIPLLLSKGQTLLKLDQAEAALGCFDEALAADPAHAEALLARGAALERLQRFAEAIECYDRAIASDPSMTMAYLHKGGVFNRMERYSEALECYEQALKCQDKSHVVEAAAA